MKNLLLKLSTRWGLFLLIILSCNKEVEVKDAFDFEVSENHKKEGYVFETAETEIEIITERKVTTTYYKVVYSVIEGSGYFQSETGNNFEEGQEIEVEGTDLKMNYLPAEVGNHKVVATVLDNKGNSKSVDLEYNIDHAPFTFLLTSQSDSYIINSKNKIGVNLIRDRGAIEGGFDFSYYINGGSGELIVENQEQRDDDQEQEIKLNVGTTFIEYLPETIGEHTIIATATAPDGAKKVSELKINVRHLNFNINVAGESNQAGVNNDYDITLNFTNEDSQSEVLYNMAFEYGEGSIGTVNLLNSEGGIIEPGKFSPIEPAVHTLTFNTQKTGRKNLVFEIKDSNGQVKKDSLIVDIQTVPINFKGSPESNNVYINQNTQFNFELTPSGETEGITYRLQFNNTAGDGVLLQNGEALEPAFPYQVTPGSFSYIFRPTTLNEHNFDFIITDSNDQEVSVTIKVQSKHVDLSFNASVGTTEMLVNNENSVTISLIENNQYEGVNYELSYFILGGQGSLYSEGNPLNPSQYFEFNPGSTTYQFIPTIPGNYEIHLLLRDSNNQVIEKVVNINAIQTSFIFNASAAYNNVPLGSSVPMNFTLTPNSTQNTATYSMTYENSNNGTLNIGGTDYSPGQIIELETNNFQGSYTPSLTGNHNLTFTVTDSNGVIKESQTQLKVSDGSFNVTATSSRVNADVDDEVNINLNINELISIGETYTGFYSSSFDGSLTINGNSYSPGQSFDLVVGDNTATYTGFDVGEHDIEFSIVSSSGNQKKDDVTINFTGGSFSFNGSSQRTSILPGETTNLNFNITELSGASTYQMAYEVESGNAEIRNESNDVLQTGTFYNVTEGNFNWLLTAISSGNIRVKFTVRNASSTEVSNTINLNVTAPSFSFSAIPSNSTGLENEPISVNVNINDNGTPGNPYNAMVSSSQNGYIIYNGIEYSFGQLINNINGSFSFDYVGNTPGNHEVDLQISNNYNVTNNSSFDLNVEVNPYLIEHNWEIPSRYDVEPFGSREHVARFPGNIFETNPSLSDNLEVKWEIVGSSGNVDGVTINWVAIDYVEPLNNEDEILENTYTTISNNSDFEIAIVIARPPTDTFWYTKTLLFTITNGDQIIEKEVIIRHVP